MMAAIPRCCISWRFFTYRESGEFAEFGFSFGCWLDPDRRSWIRKSKCICQQRKSTLDLGQIGFPPGGLTDGILGVNPFFGTPGFLGYREDTTQRVRHDKGMPRHESQRSVCSRPNCEIQYARGPSIHSTHHGV